MEIKRWNNINGVDVPLPAKQIHCEVADVHMLQDSDMDPMPQKRLATLQNYEKRFMVKSIAGNENLYVCNVEPGRMLHDVDLLAIMEYLHWQYMQPDVGMIKPAQVALAAHFGLSSAEGRLALMQIKDQMQMMQYLLLPVHCNEPLHWTVLLLKMEKDTDEVLEVKYYDWLKGLKESRAIAAKVLEYVTIDPLKPGQQPWKLPEHCNHYKQLPGSNDCGLALWQAAESCMKENRGEAKVGVLPNPVEWRKLLKHMLQLLVKEQDKRDEVKKVLA